MYVISFVSQGINLILTYNLFKITISQKNLELGMKDTMHTAWLNRVLLESKIWGTKKLHSIDTVSLLIVMLFFFFPKMQHGQFRRFFFEIKLFLYQPYESFHCTILPVVVAVNKCPHMIQGDSGTPVIKEVQELFQKMCHIYQLGLHNMHVPVYNAKAVLIYNV